MDWVKKGKFKTSHPNLETYAEIQLIARFLAGFSEEAISGLYKLWSDLGAKGCASKPFPLGKGVLKHPKILNSAAFSAKKDKD